MIDCWSLIISPFGYMKRAILLTLVGLVILVFAFVVRSLFPRPPREAADLLKPILDARMRADDSDYSRGSANWTLEEDLDGLVKNRSAAADVASVILLDYYLGAHNTEGQLCSITSRGRGILPLLIQYQQHPAGLLRPQYELFRLNKQGRDSAYREAIEAVQKGQPIGCD